MELNETLQLMAVLSAAYPAFYAKQTTDEKQAVVKVWHTMLKDIPYAVANTAVYKLIAERREGFPPSIGEFREQCVDVIRPQTEKLDHSQAWGEVEQAIRRYGSYRESEAIESFSSKTKNIVQAIGWRNMCFAEKEEISVIRGQFRRMYETMHERERKESVIPAHVGKEIARLADKYNPHLPQEKKKELAEVKQENRETNSDGCMIEIGNCLKIISGDK